MSPKHQPGSQVTGGNWRSKRTLRKRRVKPVKPEGPSWFLGSGFLGGWRNTTRCVMQVRRCWPCHHLCYLDSDFRLLTVEISRYVENMLGKKSPCFTNHLGNMFICFPSTLNQSTSTWKTLTRSWFQIFFYFHPETWGKMNPFWRAYFSKGLVQPPTSFCIISYIFWMPLTRWASWHTILWKIPKGVWLNLDQLELRGYLL